MTRSLVMALGLLCLVTGLGACTTPWGGSRHHEGGRDHQAEMDQNPEMPPAGDPTNGANGPSHSGSL